MLRRNLLAYSGLTIIAMIPGCGETTPGGTPGVSLDQVKAYLDAGVLALEAAAQQYEAGPPVPSPANLLLVQTIAGNLETVKTSLDSITIPADYKAGLLEAVALTQQLTPLVSGRLGEAAAYIPLVIAVAQAFIAQLPAPINAPPTPPAALSRKAMEYRRH